MPDTLQSALAAAEATRGLLCCKGCDMHIVGDARRRMRRVPRLEVLLVTQDSASAGLHDRLLVAFGRTKRHGVRRYGTINGMAVQTYRCAPWQLGAALLCLTGNSVYVAACKEAAAQLGLRLNQHGLWTVRNVLACDVSEEEAVLDAIGMDWIEPEERTWLK